MNNSTLRHGSHYRAGGNAIAMQNCAEVSGTNGGYGSGTGNGSVGLSRLQKFLTGGTGYKTIAGGPGAGGRASAASFKRS